MAGGTSGARGARGFLSGMAFCASERNGLTGFTENKKMKKDVAKS
jgi:hypothetical protein